MSTELCCACKQNKNITSFNKKLSNKDGLQGICKICSRKRSRQYYKNNKEKHLIVLKTKKKKYIKRNKSRIKQIKIDNGCLLCDEKEVCCLDFHHVNPEDKSFTISIDIRGTKVAWSTFVEEIKKCICVCKNCHAKIHAGLLVVNNTNIKIRDFS